MGVPQYLLERLRAIKLLLLDVDGVLTDGGLIYHDDGSESKVFDVKDGHGIKLLQRAGVEVGLLTGRYSRAVMHRARDLGIDLVLEGVRNKIKAYNEILKQKELTDKEVAFMGDDLVDIPVLKRVGLAIAVPDACQDIFPYVHYTTRHSGGKGACREVCEMILKAQDKWSSVTDRYFLD